MSMRLRTTFFLLAIACLLPSIWHIAAAMPVFGSHANPYGDAINAVGTAERHVTNMVSAVNFDYRGFDTLGEEFMLLCAVTGTVVLLRGARGEDGSPDEPAALRGRPILTRSDAVMLACRLAAPVVLLFGLYVALHATTTPGGGFQGGVIIATALLLVFLGDGYRSWRRIARSHVFNALEGFGAALYGLCGFAGMVAGQPFLANILPYGKVKDLFSGGIMVIENFGVTLAVAGGFTLLFIEFLEETRAQDDGAQKDRAHKGRAQNDRAQEDGAQDARA